MPQYACLELVGRQPGLSNADLARGAFVTRQSMNGVLRALQDRGLVSRPATAEHGRARPTEPTASGRVLINAASTAVRAVETRGSVDRTARACSVEQGKRHVSRF